MKRWLFAAKMYHTYRQKNSMHLSRHEKKKAIINRFVKIFETYAPLHVSFGIINRLLTEREGRTGEY